MFDQTFVDGEGKTNKSWTVLLSFALEFIAAGVLVLIPLLWTEVLPKAMQWNLLTAPAPPPPARPEPPRETVRRAVKVRPRYVGHELIAPPVIPFHMPIFTEEQEPLSIGVLGDGPDLGGDLGRIGLGGRAIIQPPAAPELRAPPAPQVESSKRPDGPVRQSSGVQAARCVSCPAPAYPPIAKQARIQGVVVLSAIIAKDGTVKKLAMVSSANPFLARAAMDAVAKWVYIPTILNNEPVEVSTEITVNFTLQ